MNRMSKTLMYMMGAGMIAGISYYMGLPRSKKNALKDQMADMMKLEKNMLEDYME